MSRTGNTTTQRLGEANKQLGQSTSRGARIMGLLDWLRRKLTGHDTRTGGSCRTYQASTTSSQSPRNTSQYEAQAFYERSLLCAEQGEFVEVLRNLGSALISDRHHSKAMELMERVWCPHCKLRVRQPLFSQEMVNYARFWRGVCPTCTGKLQFIPKNSKAWFVTFHTGQKYITKYSLVFNHQGGPITGVWLCSRELATASLLASLLKKHGAQTLQSDALAGDFRIVSNIYNNEGGCFVMFGANRAPGE
jgi:hypothetical protein